MRKVTAIVLLTAFLLNVFGFFTAYHLFSSKVGSKAKVANYQRLKDNNEEVVITLDEMHQTLTDFGFKRKSISEYLYYGDHYDVVKREKTPHGEKIYLKHDSFEDEILSFLNALFGTANSSGNAQQPIKMVFKKNCAKYLGCFAQINNKTRTTEYVRLLPVLIHEPPFLSVRIPPPQLS